MGNLQSWESRLEIRTLTTLVQIILDCSWQHLLQRRHNDKDNNNNNNNNNHDKKKKKIKEEAKQQQTTNNNQPKTTTTTTDNFISNVLDPCYKIKLKLTTRK